MSFQTKPKAKPRRLRRALFIALALTITVTIFTLLVLGAAGTREGGFTLGSTTFTLKYDRNNSQPAFFETETWDGPTGEFSSGRYTSLQFPGGLLILRTEYAPLESIRRRLPSDLPSLTKLLDSRNRFEVFCAAERIGEMKALALPALPKLLASAENRRDVGSAIETISGAAPRESLPLLINGLSSTNAVFAEYCANIIGDFGTNGAPAAPAILTGFQRGGPRSLNYAFTYVKITRDCTPLLPGLRKMLRADASDRTQGALLVLQECGTNAAATVPDIVALIEAKPDPYINSTALEVLSRISIDKAAVLPIFLTNVNNLVLSLPPSDFSRYNAISSLANLGPIAVPHLAAIYTGTNRAAKVFAARALAKIGPPAASHLELYDAELRTGDPRRVQLACEIIGNLGSNAAPILPTLTNLLHTPHERIRSQTALTLARLNHHSDTVIRILADSFVSENSSADLAYKALSTLIRTNTAAAAVLHERFAATPRAAAIYRQRSNTWTQMEKRQNLPPGSLPPDRSINN